jgi:iron complex outermembrane recepter protein
VGSGSLWLGKQPRQTASYDHKLEDTGDSLNTNQKIAAAIAAVLNVHVVTTYAQQTPNTSTASNSASSGTEELREVIVTAERREENLQDVPITVQTLTSEAIQRLNIQNFDDVIKYLPNVTAGGTGPGQSNIYMRGLSVGPGEVQGDGIDGDFPNVAVYLDDQSTQAPGRNLDVYAADLERIEVDEGPQGTLFGAGAEAGVLRYITNKPKLDVTEGNFTGGYAWTAHGASSGNATGVLNMPLVDNTFALRLVVYDDHRGGYINNVPGTFVRESTDEGIYYAGYTHNIPGPPTLQNSVNNNNIVANHINPVTYEGVRGELLWKFNEDWNVLLEESFQNMDAEGVFYEQPYSATNVLTGQPTPTAVALPPLSVQLYNPSDDNDQFENTALTLNGRIGILSLVYDAAYLVRKVEQYQDYTNYARGHYADYYQCLSTAQTGKPPQCYSPSTTWHESDRDVHQSHELRLSTPTTGRVRGLVGLYWEKYVLYDETDWLYKTAPGFTSVGPPAGTCPENPGVRNANDSFFDCAERGYQQYAAFGSLDYDIIPQKLTLTAGTRWFRFNNFQVGSAVGSFGCYGAGPPPCQASASNLYALNERNHDIGTRSRINLTWHITPDIMAYYTFSQGFRPGGFNRSEHYSTVLDYKTPLAWAPDTLTNNEVGAKTEWFNHRLQLNTALYQENWSNVITQFFDPTGGLGNLAFETNGPKYRVRGVELQMNAIVTHGLTFEGSAAVDSSSQLNSPYLTNIYGRPITSIPNPYGSPGSTLAQSPPFAASGRARYQWNVAGDYRPFVQVGANHQGPTHSATGYVLNYVMPEYTTYDAFAGVSRGQWTLQSYCNNFTNKIADLLTQDTASVLGHTAGRPRTCGLTYSYQFMDK